MTTISVFLFFRGRIKVKAGTGAKKRSRGDAEGTGGDTQLEDERGGEAAVKKLLDSLPSGLLVVTNFGLVDICPELSGKHNAAAYIATEHFGIPLESCASMGDDDNDIALVSLPVAVLLEGISLQRFFFCVRERHAARPRANLASLSDNVTIQYTGM